MDTGPPIPPRHGDGPGGYIEWLQGGIQVRYDLPTECSIQYALGNGTTGGSDGLSFPGKPAGRIGILPNSLKGNILVQTSPFGVIPKKAKLGKWRLIIDLSAPCGHSVNDGIDKELCSISYMKIIQVIDRLLSLAPCALMAKIDIEHACRNIPVHPDNRHLLATQWQDDILVIRSSPSV